jgi:hypothetical protein
MKRLVLAVAVFLFCLPAFRITADPRGVAISLVQDPGAAAPVKHGVESLKAALRAKNIRYEEVANLEAARGQTAIVYGSGNGSGPAADRLKASAVAVSGAPESLVIHWAEWKSKPLLLLSGSDDRGLMYSLLEVADRIGWALDPGKPLSEVHNIQESPTVTDRGVTIFTMQQAQFETRLHDENYWTKYFDTLARDRFNKFQVLFAYEMDGYMCPAYPYFVDTPGFADVKVEGPSSPHTDGSRSGHPGNPGLLVPLLQNFYQLSKGQPGSDRYRQSRRAQPYQPHSLHPCCSGDDATGIPGGGPGPVSDEPRIRLADQRCRKLLDQCLPGDERSSSESPV